MKRLIVLFLVAVCLLFGTAAHAGIALYDIDATPGGWLTAVTGLTPMTAYNFDLDPDYGILGIDAPLTSAGAFPVSAGILADGVVMDRIDLGGSPRLAALGPGGSYGNVSNAILADYFVDGFTILSLPGAPKALAFNALTLVGSGMVDISVNGSVVFSGIAVGTGHNLGVVATGGDTILSLGITDLSDGVEGVQGLGTLYYDQNVVPAPGAFVLGLIGIGCVNRIRRRK